MEIKLPNGETFNVIKDYLTSEELQAIIHAISNEREYINRINARDALLAGIMTDIEAFKGDKIDFPTIDEYRRLGAFKLIMNQLPYDYIDIIEEGVRHEDSINVQLTDMVQYIQTKIDELPKATKNVSTTKIVNAINKLGEQFTTLVKENEHLNETLK
jgi:hypothetical protein